MKVTVIDYGLSNLLSVQHAFAHFGAEVQVTSSPADVLAADALVLPGVGAFQDGMQGLEQLGLIEPSSKRRPRVPVAGDLPWDAECCLTNRRIRLHKALADSRPRGAHPGCGRGRQPQRVPHISWNPLYPAGGRTDFPVPPCRMCSRDRNAISSTLMKQSPQRRNTAWPIPCMAAARCAPLPKRAA